MIRTFCEVRACSQKAGSVIVNGHMRTPIWGCERKLDLKIQEIIRLLV